MYCKIFGSSVGIKHFIQARYTVSRGYRTWNAHATCKSQYEQMVARHTHIHASSPARAPRRLQLSTGGFIIPHPQKVAKGGEDAFFITNQAFGIADGVGGWVTIGIDPGTYARTLMREARGVIDAQAKEQPDEDLNPATILQLSYMKSRNVIGSSTACIMCLEREELLAVNIGDSGFLVVRDGTLHFATTPQQHRFNFPFQIGTQGDPPASAQRYQLALEPGDVIIAGTDGLFDNVFSTRSAKLVWEAQARGAAPSVAAQQLCTYASARALDPQYQSPFAKAAMEAGVYYRGGKVDDITVVVAYVLEAVEAEKEEQKGESVPMPHGPHTP